MAHYKSGENVKIGDRVVRGSDWKPSAYDSGLGHTGIVKELRLWKNNNFAVTVQWEGGKVDTYVMGVHGPYKIDNHKQ